MAVPITLLLSQLRSATQSQREERSTLGGPIDEALAGGILRGAVVEICSPHGRARATSLALRACVAAQEEAWRFGSAAYCAWIDPARTLFAPGARARGVDLARLVVVTPAPEVLARVMVRVTESRAFAVVVADATSLASLDRLPTVVRRLSLAVEGTACSVLVLTTMEARRSLPLPVAARIELSRTVPGAIDVRIAKDRYGRIRASTRVPWDEA